MGKLTFKVRIILAKASEVSILIVDDEKDFREVLLERFRLFGFSVKSAANGTAAWDILLSEKIDIVITDVRMPNGSGIDLLKKIRKVNFSTPKVFVITGFTDHSPQEILQLGADGFFPKPFSATDLRNTIQTALVSDSDRYSQPCTEPAEQSYEYRWHHLEFPISKNIFRMGRKGFSLVVEKKPSEDKAVVEFDLSTEDGFELKGKGRYVWSHQDKQGQQHIGVEIIHLEPKSIKEFTTWIRGNKPTAFIPYNSSL